MKKFLCLLGIAFFGQFIYSQDYSQQLKAIQKAIANQEGANLQQHISPEMAIPPLLTKEQITPELLNRVLKDIFGRIQSVSLEDSKAGEMILFYDFKDAKTKDRTSSVLLDGEGKIKEIKIISELIEEEREKTASQDAEQPIADELTKKYPPTKVKFNTPDGRIVVGNLYEVGQEKPIILLGHQAGTNKYEYADIAPKLNAMGYNALAIDLSGEGTFAGHNNETLDKGSDVGNDRQIIQKRTGQELNTAVDYLHEKYKRNVIVWGSSLSANFAILVAAKNKHTKAAISFSGLANQLANVLPQIEKPLFLTGSKEEAPRLQQLLSENASQSNIVVFIPKSKGGHGSRVLWNGQPYAEEYWSAVKSFLNQFN